MTSQPEPKPVQSPEPDRPAPRNQRTTTAVLLGAALSGATRAFVDWALRQLTSN